MTFIGVNKMWLKNHDEEIQKQEQSRLFKLLEPYEWSGFHTDYEDSWAVMTRACPFCLNAKEDGHKESCLLKSLRAEEVGE